MKLNFCEEQGTVCILFILCKKHWMKPLQYTGFARREYIWAEDNDSQPKVFNHYIFLVITLIPISSTVLWFDLASLAGKQQATSCFWAPTHPSTKHYVIMSAKLLFPQTSFICNEYLTFWGFKYSLVYGGNQFFWLSLQIQFRTPFSCWNRCV